MLLCLLSCLLQRAKDWVFSLRSGNGCAVPPAQGRKEGNGVERIHSLSYILRSAYMCRRNENIGMSHSMGGMIEFSVFPVRIKPLVSSRQLLYLDTVAWLFIGIVRQTFYNAEK